MGKKSIAVLGLGRFGESMALELSRAGAEVMAVDIDEERVAQISEDITYAVKADVCDVETMERLGLSNMDAVIVAITNNLNASIMGTILAKEAGVPFVLAKSGNDIHTKILEKVGADKITVPERETGVRMARNMVSGNFLDFIELSDRIRMIELAVKSEWVGKRIIDLNLRKKHNINIVAIRQGGELNAKFNPDIPLAGDETLLVIMDRSDIPKLAK